MDLIAEQLQRAYPKDNAKTGIAVVDLRGLLSPASRTLVGAVFAAALCLLLIACTNLANLLYARAMMREHEIQVRVAVGAARGRVIRQLLTENFVLAMLGGTLGAMLAVSASPLLTRLVPGGLPVTRTPDMDLRVLAFAIILTLSTTVVFGVGPAWRLSRLGNLRALRLRSAGGPQTQRLRTALVLAEVTGTMVLLVAAGLLVKALWRVQALDPGFRTQGVLTLRTALPMPKYGDAAVRRDFYERVLGETRKLPGVTSAAYASYQPMEPFSGGFTVVVPGLADDRQRAPRAIVHFVTPDFFATLGISVRRGRTVTTVDDNDGQPVVVVSESLVDALWPGTDPVGHRVNVGAAGDRTVVGVVENIAVRSLEGAGRYGRHQVYFPIIYGSSALLAMLMTLAGSLRPAIRASSINPALTIRAE